MAGGGLNVTLFPSDTSARSPQRFRPRETSAVLLFESLLGLSLVAVLLLWASRHLAIPYPTLLALAGVLVAVLPFAPAVEIEPHLALVLFIAPALLDAGYDTSPRDLRRHWISLLSLAVLAVLATALAVAAVGWAWAGLPFAAALTLGAIVAPPDAAAANAVLSRLGLPRRSMMVLQGESLLNDATALLIFGAASAWAMSDGTSGGGLLGLALEAPGGVLLGLVIAWPYLRLQPYFAGTLSATVIEFTATFGVWLLADRLHVSPVLTVVTFAMAVARGAPVLQSARDRVQSTAVWSVVVFVLNVLAFLLMGLQARSILSKLEPEELWPALATAVLVLVVVVVVRIAWVMLSRLVVGPATARVEGLPEPPPWRASLLVSWCGMRGLLTLATAFALPADFPARDVVVLSAFSVVLGTLVVQGLTITPLMHLLRLENDGEMDEELAEARGALASTALEAAAREKEDVAQALRLRYSRTKQVASSPGDPLGSSDYDQACLRVVQAQRQCLHALRRSGRVADDVFHQLQEELDWAELDARPHHENELREA
jgi:CPA1 family monovalent cation:H+ antiporter